MPDAELVDLSIKVVAPTFLTFDFDLTLLLRKVVITYADLSVMPLRPLKVSWVFPEVPKSNLSAVRLSVPPSERTNTYLSSS